MSISKKDFIEYVTYRELALFKQTQEILSKLCFKDSQNNNLMFGSSNSYSEDYQSWLNRHVPTEKISAFNYHLKACVENALCFNINSKSSKSGAQEKRVKLKKYKKFIECGNIFSKELLKDEEELFNNPAGDLVAHLVNKVSKEGDIPSEKHKKFLDFKDNLIDSLEIIEKAITDYEKGIKNKPLGNKEKTEERFIALAVISVYGWYFPKKLKKTRNILDDGVLENRPLYNLLKIVFSLFPQVRTPADLKHYVTNAIDSYRNYQQSILKKTINAKLN